MALNRRMVIQVTMPAILIAISLLVTSLIGIRSINRLQANRDQIVSKNVRGLQSAQELVILLRQLRFRSFLYVMEPTTKRWEPVEEDETEFKFVLERVRRIGLTAEEESLADAIDSGYLNYHSELLEAKKNPPGPGRKEFLDWADQHPVRHIVAPCEILLDLNRQAMAAAVERSARESDQTRQTMLWLAVIGTLGGLIGGFGVAWGLSRSITRLRVRLQDVHAHLDQEVASLRFTAEGGDLQTMNIQVERLLTRVREVVDQIQHQEREHLRAEQLAAVGRLAASIAHEVRNPLTSIKLLVSAALRGRPSKTLSELDLQVIHDEVQRLERKVQNLLNFARPEEMERQPDDLNEIIHHAVELIRARLVQQSIELKLWLPETPTVVNLDRNQVVGVLVNLFLNALDAMPNGGTLEVQLEQSSSGRIRLTVSDTGTGIDQKVADRLFAPFVSTKPTGTGLGLSVSQRIVQAHGGTIEVAGRPGGGTALTISIPAGRS